MLLLLKQGRNRPALAYNIGLKLNSWRATAVHSLGPTLIKRTWSS